MLTSRLGLRTQNTRRSSGKRTQLRVTNLATRALDNISLFLVHIRALNRAVNIGDPGHEMYQYSLRMSP